MAASGEDTIVALSSGRPPAAVAIVRASGPRAFEGAQRLIGDLPPPRHASVRRIVDPNDGSPVDEAVVLRFDAPRSSTGENIIEFQCHGGKATIDALIRSLLSLPGFRMAEPGEFTRRALHNGRLDLTEAEGLADLLAAETELQRRSALARAGGGLRSRIDDWRGRSLAFAARAEVAIDYSDEEDGSADPQLAEGLRALAQEMDELLAAPRVEPLRDGIRVVVAGPPNAGKSSLVNALCQADRAIVTPIAGTTRDVIEVPLSIAGVPFLLIDTAGLRDSGDEVEAIGIERAQGEIDRADLLLWLGDAGEAPAHSKCLLVRAKADLERGRSAGGERPFSVSSVTGAGIASLSDRLVAEARDLLPQGDQLALDRRQHDLLERAKEAVRRAADLSDPLLVAEELRSARHSIDLISGRAGVEDLLDVLFGRFCLGK